MMKIATKTTIIYKIFLCYCWQQSAGAAAVMGKAGKAPQICDHLYR
jgi:hypothetical protein